MESLLALRCTKRSRLFAISRLLCQCWASYHSASKPKQERQYASVFEAEHTDRIEAGTTESANGRETRTRGHQLCPTG